MPWDVGPPDPPPSTGAVKDLPTATPTRTTATTPTPTPTPTRLSTPGGLLPDPPAPSRPCHPTRTTLATRHRPRRRRSFALRYLDSPYLRPHPHQPHPLPRPPRVVVAMVVVRGLPPVA